MSTRYIWGKYQLSQSEGTYSIHKTNHLSELEYNKLQAGTSFAIQNGKFILIGETLDIYPDSSDRIYTKSYPYLLSQDGKVLFVYEVDDWNTYWYFTSYDYNETGVWVYDRLDINRIIDFDVYLNPKNGAASQGSLIDYISSSSSSAYPSNGVSGSYWYKYLGSDSIDPYSVFYSTTTPKQGENIAISISPRTPTYGKISYTYYFSLDGGTTWTQLVSGTSTTSFVWTFPTYSKQFRVRVLASDNLGFTSSTYIVGDNLVAQTSSGNNFIGIDGVARKIEDIYIGVNGVARKVVEGYIGIDGVARKFYG